MNDTSPTKQCFDPMPGAEPFGCRHGPVMLAWPRSSVQVTSSGAPATRPPAVPCCATRVPQPSHQLKFDLSSRSASRNRVTAVIRYDRAFQLSRSLSKTSGTSDETVDRRTPDPSRTRQQNMSPADAHLLSECPMAWSLFARANRLFLGQFAAAVRRVADALAGAGVNVDLLGVLLFWAVE